jgi:hypothetical protein
MGADFLDTTDGSRKKSRQRARTRLVEPGLFDAQPNTVESSAPFDILPNVDVQAGENLRLVQRGAELVGLRGLAEVVATKNPPKALYDKVIAQGGIANVVIDQTYSISRKADVSLK